LCYADPLFFVEGESLYIDGDVDGAVSAWLKYLHNVPGIFLRISRHFTTLLLSVGCANTSSIVFQEL